MDAAGAAIYQVARQVLGSAARSYFGRIHVRHVDRVPPKGPLLVVANHPASFTDVVVLATSLPRRLHFLAMAPIFKPWIRGLALRLGGALPIYRRQDDPTLMHRNEDTFRAVNEILRRGGGVLIFPEGTSKTDRSIVKVKTGAARIVLGHGDAAGAGNEVTLLPIGLHFAERTGFRSDVTVSVGRPFDLASFREKARSDSELAVRRLTDDIQLALEKLILNVPEEDLVPLIHAIEQLYADEAKTKAQGVPEVGLARGMAEVVQHFARTDPARVIRGWKMVQAYQRDLAALEVNDRAIKEMLPRRGRTLQRMRLVALGVLGLVPAAVGGLAHYIPYRLSAQIGMRLARDPTEVAMFRMGLGALLFPAMYLGLGTALHLGLAWPLRQTVIVLIALVPLGFFSILYFTWLTHQRQRIRLVVLKMKHRRVIATLRRERRELIRTFEQARRDYQAVRGEAALP